MATATGPQERGSGTGSTYIYKRIMWVGKAPEVARRQGEGRYGKLQKLRRCQHPQGF